MSGVVGGLWKNDPDNAVESMTLQGSHCFQEVIFSMWDKGQYYWQDCSEVKSAIFKRLVFGNLYPVGAQTSVERDDISLQKSDWCKKSEMGTTITFLELKLQIQNSLNWPKIDTGHPVFLQVGKQLQSIISGWSSSMKQLGRELDEHLLSLCEAKAGAREKGSISQSWCPPWRWGGLSTLPQQWNLLGRWQHKPLVKYTQGKIQQQTNKRGSFSPVEAQNEMVALVSPRM